MKYRTSRRINWSYYNRLIDNLHDLGISESSLPPRFPNLHWTGHKHWLESRYPNIFVCVRCHIPRDYKTGKHPNKSLCVDCARVYVTTPRYFDDTELGGAPMPKMMNEDIGEIGGQAASSLPELQRKMEEKLRQQRSEERGQPRGNGVVNNILTRAGKQALLEDIQHEPPLVISKTEGPTSVQLVHEGFCSSLRDADNPCDCTPTTEDEDPDEFSRRMDELADKAK